MNTGGARLARSAIHGQVAKIAQSGLGLVTGLVLARTLGPAGVGVYASAFAVAVLVQMAASFGLEDLILSRVPGLFASGQKAQGQQVLRACAQLRIRVFVFLIAIAIPLALLGRYTRQTGSFTWTMIALAVAYAGLNSLATLGAAMRAARFEALRPSLLDTGWYLLVASGIAIMASLRILTPFRAVALGVAAEALAVIGYYLLVAPDFTGSNATIRDIPKKPVSVFWINAILAYGIGKSSDLLLIRLSGSPYSAVGLYNAAFNVFMLASTFLLAAVGTFAQVGLADAIGQGDNSRIARTWQRSVVLIALVSFPSLGFLIIRARATIDFFFGHAFRGAASPLIVLAGTALVIRAFGGGASQGILYASNRQFASLMIRMSGVLLNVVGDIFLLRAWGIAGVAAATGTCGIVVTLLEYRAARRMTHLPHPTRGIAAVSCGTAIACAMTYPLPTVAGHSSVILVVHGILFFLIFYVTQITFKPLRRDDAFLNQLPHLLRGFFATLTTDTRSEARLTPQMTETRTLPLDRVNLGEDKGDKPAS